jgi:alkanesulfonate monooxygenase SsuD/methylene tetrahydromethanopterin reductase-like flavin-dependent oxidoreductase (luciferase family)
MNFTIAPNPLLNLIDLARRTKHVRLGTATIIAPFWHPIKLAGEAAMADIIMDGRLDLGIARGAYVFEYERLMPGLDAWAAGQRMRELIPAVKALWVGDYAHDGEFWNFPATTSSPQPVQNPHPPIWVAARDPSSHEFAVANGCNVQVTPLALGDVEVETLMARFNAACAKFPQQPRPKIMVLRHTYVAENEPDARRAAVEINQFYNYFGAWFKNDRPVSQGLIKPLSEDEIAQSAMYSPEKMRTNNIIGEAPEVISRIKPYAAMGYDEFSLWIDSGMSFPRKKASLERFIANVMPAFA